MAVPLYSQTKDSLYFFNSNLLFVPTEASIFESKVGVIKYTDKKNLKLDIGVSIDLAGYKHNKNTYSFGVDFFTFSNLRSEKNFKFPVDAIDYLFGINLNSKSMLSANSELSSRLRVSHVSSHFEDGHIYERADTIFKPVIFSKEFIDLAAIFDMNIHKNFHLKNLIALNYIFHSIPADMSKFSARYGIELRYFVSKFLSLYISNDLNLASVNSELNLNENAEAGLSFGMFKSRSFNLYFAYYDGQDYRGQYYGKYLNNKGIGLRIKF